MVCGSSNSAMKRQQVVQVLLHYQLSFTNTRRESVRCRISEWFGLNADTSYYRGGRMMLSGLLIYDCDILCVCSNSFVELSVLFHLVLVLIALKQTNQHQHIRIRAAQQYHSDYAKTEHTSYVCIF